jgi:hypothetical protein
MYEAVCQFERPSMQVTHSFRRIEEAASWCYEMRLVIGAVECWVRRWHSWEV